MLRHPKRRSWSLLRLRADAELLVRYTPHVAPAHRPNGTGPNHAITGSGPTFPSCGISLLDGSNTIVAQRNPMATLPTAAVGLIPMTYTLHRLAAGSYDLILGDAIVGTVVREVARNGDARGWHAELLSGALPLPVPFTQEAHQFSTLEETIAWLGGAIIRNGN